MAEPARRLAAVLAADVAGYTRLMQADEAGTHAELKRLRPTIDAQLAAHNGRLVKNTGDGFLAEFSSVVQAATAALQMQREIGERQKDRPASNQLLFRMGLSLGDVIFDDGDIFGDGVNLAARLETIAPPGGICISAVAAQQVRGRVECSLRSLGPVALKNMGEKVEVFVMGEGAASGHSLGHPRQRARLVALAAAGILAIVVIVAAAFWRADFLGIDSRPKPPPADAANAQRTSVKPVIAVLPLTNLSGDSSQDYFADGLTEDLIGDLGRFSSLAVLARSAVEHLRGANLPLAEITGRLSVRYFVQGSVRRSGERLRLFLQLTEASNGTVLWAHQFDAAESDLFALQDQVVNQLAGRLASQVATMETRRVLNKSTENLEAYDHLLRGRALLSKLTRAANVQAREHFRRAIELDSQFAAPYAESANTFLNAVQLGWTGAPDDTLDEAEKLARQALALDSNLVAAFVVLARLASIRANHDQALVLARQAIAINASDAQAFKGLGGALTWLGQAEEAVIAFETARNLGAGFLQPERFYFALAYFALRRHAEALEVLVDPVAGEVGLPASLALLASLHVEMGEMPKARTAYTELRRRAPYFDIDRYGDSLRDTAVAERLRAALSRAAAP
jgi:adenylate cyclase